MRGNFEEVKSLKTKIEFLKEEIKQLKEVNTAKEILLLASGKSNEILKRELAVKDKSVEQCTDKMLTVKNALNEREQTIIELKHKLDVSSEKISTFKQHIQELSDIKSGPTNTSLLTISTKEPSRFKCKYCGKNFSLSTILEGHIKDYHIPRTTHLNTSGQKKTC